LPYVGSGIRIRNEVRDWDGSLVNPASHDIKIYDPDNVEKYSLTTPVNPSIGVFYFDYQIPSDAKEGLWKCVWTVGLGGYSFKEVLEFLVKGV